VVLVLLLQLLELLLPMRVEVVGALVVVLQAAMEALEVAVLVVHQELLALKTLAAQAVQAS
jgi:hypothetical protein